MKKEMKSFYVTPSVTVFELNTEMLLAGSPVDVEGNGVDERTNGDPVDSRYSDDDWDEDE